MQEIIKETFPLLPTEFSIELERAIHNYLVYDKLGEFCESHIATRQLIEQYAWGILSAAYMAGFIDGEKHNNDDIVTEELWHKISRSAYDFYL